MLEGRYHNIGGFGTVNNWNCTESFMLNSSGDFTRNGKLRHGAFMPKKTRLEKLSLLGISMFVLLAGMICVPLASAAGALSFIESFDSFPSNGSSFNSPSAIALGSSGNIYVADQSNNRVLKLKSDGTMITSWGSYGTANGQFYAPQGIVVDLNNDIWVADTNNHRLQKFASDGTWLATIGTLGSLNGQFSSPQGLAKDAAGNIWVADTGNHRIQKLKNTGGWLASFGSNGAGSGQFNNPRGLAFDSSGNFYVADTSNNRVQKFSGAGAFMAAYGTYGTTVGKLNNPNGVFVTGTTLFVVDTYNHRIQKLNATGGFAAFAGTYGTAASSGSTIYLNYPRAATFDASGKILVVDTSNNRIQRLNAGGTFDMSFGTAGGGNGGFNNPYDVALKSNFAYVVDTYNHRIEKFNCDGTFLASYGTYGSAASSGSTIYLNYPKFVTFDAAGKFVIADSSNNRIQRLNIDETFNLSFGSAGGGNGGFNNPYDVTIDSSGNIYVVDTYNHSIKKYSSARTFISSTGTYGTAASSGSLIYLSYPKFATIDAAGKLVIVDSSNNRIQRLKTDLTLDISFGSSGSGNGQFNGPSAAALDASGKDRKSVV